MVIQPKMHNLQLFSGTMLPVSGGEYAYIMESFGPLPAFLFMWVALIVIVPSGNAILALTFANYLLQPFWPDCVPPDLAVRLISAAVIGTFLLIEPDSF
jgi:L-type amino acid transporter 5